MLISHLYSDFSLPHTLNMAGYIGHPCGLILVAVYFCTSGILICFICIYIQFQGHICHAKLFLSTYPHAFHLSLSDWLQQKCVQYCIYGYSSLGETILYQKGNRVSFINKTLADCRGIFL